MKGVIVLDNFNNLYVPIRERIFTLTKSKAFSQKDFAKSIKISAETITAWKAGRNYSFMKKLKSIASALDTTEVWLLTGKDTPDPGEIEKIADSLGIHPLDLIGSDGAWSGEALKKQEAHPMNANFEIDPTLLDDAVEVMRFAVDCCEADAAALARLDSPEARELAQARLQMAKKADGLLFFFAKQ